MCDESRRRWINETSESKSSASALVIVRWMRGSCAVGLRNMANASDKIGEAALFALFALGVDRIDG